MTIDEYFGDWSMIIDLKEVERIMKKLMPVKSSICPVLQDIFKAFRLCSFHDTRCIVISQDPYPTLYKGKPIATGIAFANPITVPEDSYSPSLEVLKESIINFSIPHGHINFDPSLEKWENQGVLLLNTALTCLKGRPNSHMLLWRPFITALLSNISKYATGIVYVLMGNVAQSLEPYINGRNNYIIKTKHPAWYARKKEKMPSDVWIEINRILTDLNGYGIEWYNEVKF